MPRPFALHPRAPAVPPPGLRAGTALWLSLTSVLASPSLAAQGPEGLGTPGRPATSGDQLRVFLLTMDQGDEVWERFGHNALLVRNEATGEEIAWNWGLFDFQDVDFIPRFLRGTMRYAMGGFPPELMLQEYVRANRTVYRNEVFLTPAQAAELDAFVRWNAREENRYYTYHYFRDNCSTRVRDVLDRVLDGALERHFASRETPHSYRWHTRRLVQETAWIDQGLSFLLGLRGDRPRTEWEAMFIPMEMMELLEEFEVEDPEWADATADTRSLLGPREILFQADRPPTPTGPPSFSVRLLLAGLVGGVVVAGLGDRVPGAGRGRRATTGGLVLGWGLVSGTLGSLLLFAWFTDHDFIQWNLNLLYASPVALPAGIFIAAAVASPRTAAGWAGQVAWILSVIVAGTALLAAVLQAIGVVSQGNGEVVALALPLNLALAWCAWRVRRPGAGGGGAVRRPQERRGS